MYLISPHQKQYKANLHAHTVHSDGKKTPQELKDLYKGEGYSVLAITDHESPRSHAYLTDADFIAITGYEAYLRKDPICVFEPYGQEVHLNLFARDPSNTAYVCYNPNYCKYMPVEEQERLVKVGSQRPREYSVAYFNEFIRTAKENGYIVAFNHPWWSMMDEADMLAMEGCFSMEMSNYSNYLIARMEYNGALYDKMLKAGKRIACHSADDNHNAHPVGSPQCDSFGGFAMIMPEEFTYDGIIRAMETGAMYSSMGPLFKEVSMEGNRLHVECSEVDRITVLTGSKTPKRVFAPVGQTITCADFEVDERAQFVRVSIADRYGRFADTRGFFRDELEF